MTRSEPQDSDPDGTVDVARAPELLRSSLLDGVIHLFAALASADGRLERGESDYVRKYLAEHIDGPRCDILMGLFEARAASTDPTTAAVDFIHDRGTRADRAFLLLKGAELVHQSRTPEAGRQRFRDIADRMGFVEADTRWALNFAEKGDESATSPRFQALRIRPAAADEDRHDTLGLPGCEAALDVVFTEGTTLIRCLSSSESIRVGSRVPAVDSLIRLDESEPLFLGSLRLSARDLRFYQLRQGDHCRDRVARCFIARDAGDFSLFPEPPQGSCLELALHGSRLSLTPLKPATAGLGDDECETGHRRGPSQAVTVATTFRYGGKVLSLRPILQTLWPADWEERVDRSGESPGPALPPVSGRPIASLRLTEVDLVYPGGHVGLDQISFETQFGQLVCLLGPSGCGKSTLLNVLNGSLEPTRGQVTLDGQRIADAARHISYVPQDDLLDPNLTIAENLRFGAELRMPGASRAAIEAAVDRVLREIGLTDWRDTRVGDATARTLSGGQRKRVNIGLELLGNRRILLLDEPTSGLSAADAWQVGELLRRRADQGDLVMVVAHQPSARLLDLFTHVVVLDRGGRLAFFGSTPDAYAYFSPYAPRPPVTSGGEGGANAAGGTRDPETIFTALERRSRHIDGSRSNQRRYPPTFWQANYRANESQWRPPLLRVKTPAAAAAPERNSEGADASSASTPAARQPTDSRLGIQAARFATLLKREFLSRSRALSHLSVAFLSALLLGAAIAWACRLDFGGEYSFAENPALPSFMFLGAVTALFLAMSASVPEIVRDRPLRQRERLLQVPTGFYLASKFLPLLCLVMIQTALFLAVAYRVLEIPELFGAWWLVLTVTACCGLGIGLLVSSLPGISAKAASAAIPLLLIPQIILAGADPFPFKNMIHLRFGGPQLAVDSPASSSETEAGEDSGAAVLVTPPGYTPPPQIAQVVPSRWAYEGLVCLYRDHGLARRIDDARRQMRARLEPMFAEAEPPLEWKSNHLPKRLTSTLRALTTASIATDAEAGRAAVSDNERFLALSGGRPCSPELVEWFVLHKSLESGEEGWQSLPPWMQGFRYSPGFSEWWPEPEARPLNVELPVSFQHFAENEQPNRVRLPITGVIVSPTTRAIIVLLAFTAVLLIAAWACLRFESLLATLVRAARRRWRTFFSGNSASEAH